jgi:hypothetical protein
LRQAANDPRVLAIKQTLYRSGTNSEIVQALAEAARKGKEVTAVIELRARFDEKSNIEVANFLQQAGAVVVYGIVGYKTHAKLMMIVRREEDKIRRYVHLGTGNYHAGNAKAYTDYGLFTANEAITEDVHKIFNELTGMGKPAKVQKLLHAPFTLHDRLMGFIDNEIAHAKAGKEAHIIIKVNAMTEKLLIDKLYEASQAGVKVNLIIRSMCCIRPQLPGVSDNITVRSIVGRFLEHTRVYYFANGHQNPNANGKRTHRLYCASADWMERNLFSRVEVAFPIEDPIVFNGGRDFKEWIRPYTGGDGLPHLLKHARRTKPEYTFEVIDNRPTFEVQIRNAETLEVSDFKTPRDAALHLGLKTSRVKFLCRLDRRDVFHGHQFRIKSDEPWPDPSEHQWKPQCIEIQRVSDGVTLQFASLRELAAHLGVDRSTLKYRIKTGLPYGDWIVKSKA